MTSFIVIGVKGAKFLWVQMHCYISVCFETVRYFESNKKYNFFIFNSLDSYDSKLHPLQVLISTNIVRLAH